MGLGRGDASSCRPPRAGRGRDRAPPRHRRRGRPPDDHPAPAGGEPADGAGRERADQPGRRDDDVACRVRADDGVRLGDTRRRAAGRHGLRAGHRDAHVPAAAPGRLLGGRRHQRGGNAAVAARDVRHGAGPERGHAHAERRRRAVGRARPRRRPGARHGHRGHHRRAPAPAVSLQRAADRRRHGVGGRGGRFRLRRRAVARDPPLRGPDARGGARAERRGHRLLRRRREHRHGPADAAAGRRARRGEAARAARARLPAAPRGRRAVEERAARSRRRPLHHDGLSLRRGAAAAPAGPARRRGAPRQRGARAGLQHHRPAAGGTRGVMRIRSPGRHTPADVPTSVISRRREGRRPAAPPRARCAEESHGKAAGVDLGAGGVVVAGARRRPTRLDTAPRMPRSLRSPALLAAVLALLLAAPASADPVVIASAPLTIHIGERGQLQAQRSGDAGGMFFPPLLPTGDAGFFLAFPAATVPPPLAVAGKVYGFQGGSGPTGLVDYSLDRQGDVTGTGTAADPFVQQTSYGVPFVAEVLQTTTYVAGESAFAVQWTVHNVTDAPLTFKALVAADLAVDGSDDATGVYTDAPRFVGGTNPQTGRSAGFAELPAASESWSHYAALAFGPRPTQVWGEVRAAGASAAPTFADTILGGLADAAVGVEWDGHLTAPLAPGERTSFAVTVRSAAPAALRLTPAEAGSAQGTPVSFAVTARDGQDAPYAGRTVRFSIAGANPGGGEAVTDAGGNATLVDPGRAAGDDTVVAYVDLDGDAVRDPGESQASAIASFVDRTAPACSPRVRARRGTARLILTVRCRERAAVNARVTLVARDRRRVRLSGRRAIVLAGRPARLRIAVPAAVRSRYAGAAVTAVVAVTATDVAGNVRRARATRRVRLP